MKCYFVSCRMIWDSKKARETFEIHVCIAALTIPLPNEDRLLSAAFHVYHILFNVCRMLSSYPCRLRRKESWEPRFPYPAALNIVRRSLTSGHLYLLKRKRKLKYLKNRRKILMILRFVCRQLAKEFYTFMICLAK